MDEREMEGQREKNNTMGTSGHRGSLTLRNSYNAHTTQYPFSLVQRINHYTPQRENVDSVFLLEVLYQILFTLLDSELVFSLKPQAWCLFKPWEVILHFPEPLSPSLSKHAWTYPASVYMQVQTSMVIVEVIIIVTARLPRWEEVRVLYFTYFT